jgi:hypothetical protein
MSHSNTDRMLAYWEARREHRPAPLRSAIDPTDFSDIMTQAFVVGRERSGVYPFRLAGALIEDLHRGPLLAFDFAELWTTTDRPRLQSAIEAALQRGDALLVQALGRTLAGNQARLEILMAPVADASGQIDRLLGFYQPVSPLFRLQNQPVHRLFLLEATFAGSGEAAPEPLRLASVGGRRIA